MKIIGTSGVSILLAGQVMMRHDPTIYISEPELINKHSAVLRFKSDKIFKFLNIPAKQVTIDKAIWYGESLFNTSNLRLQNMYSQKVTGNILDRSIRDMSSEVRYIAPDNFFDLLKIGLNIKTGCNLMDELFDGNYSEPKLSYIKMPDVMDKVGVEKPDFSFNPVYTINARIISPKVNVYQTVYFPDPDEDIYRASITENELIVELIRSISNDEEYIRDLMSWLISDVFCIDQAKFDNIRFNVLPVGKMNPIDDSIRKGFIGQLTQEYNIYSFGRNGIWKSIRLDQLFDDLMKVDNMIRNGSYYTRLNR